MFLHLALDGVSDGSLGVGLDVVDAAARVVAAGLSPCPPTRGALTQRVLSVDGESVRSGAGRTIAVDGSLRRARLRAGDVLVPPGLSSTTESVTDRLLAPADVVGAAASPVARAAARACGAAAVPASFRPARSGHACAGGPSTARWLGGWAL